MSHPLSAGTTQSSPAVPAGKAAAAGSAGAPLRRFGRARHLMQSPASSLLLADGDRRGLRSAMLASLLLVVFLLLQLAPTTFKSMTDCCFLVLLLDLFLSVSA